MGRVEVKVVVAMGRLLWEYNKQDTFSQFKRYELKNYPQFLEVLEDFQETYNLGSVGLEKLDKFLWMYGKELF